MIRDHSGTKGFRYDVYQSSILKYLSRRLTGWRADGLRGRRGIIGEEARRLRRKVRPDSDSDSLLKSPL